MWELLDVAFSAPNVVLTTMLIVVIIYWLVVILGGLDLDFLNIDFGADVDVDVDADVDADLPLGGGFHAILLFFHVGHAPLVVLLSILILSMWTISVLGNYYLNPMGSWLLATAILGGNLVVSLMLVKIVGSPIGRFFQMFTKDYNAPRAVIGRIGRVLSTVTSDRVGQVEVKTKGAPVVLSALTKHGKELPKGAEAVVVGRDKTKGVYFVAPVELENER